MCPIGKDKAGRQGEPAKYKPKTKRFFLSEQDVCLPCNCKGHAEYCNDITGICINCRNHSTGDFCEMCEDGYMLTRSPNGRHTCQPCACPLSTASNNFAVRCDRRSSILRCKCQEGYAGHFCERCAPGYYGNPMAIGSSCKKCDCNGNSDPNLIFNECHNMTGHCQHCWANTAGAKCEKCAPGFYGDAISAKNCRECDCESGHCDPHTGECLAEAATFNLCDTNCDTCIWHLIEDLQLSNKTLDQLKVGVLNISTGAAANDRLKYYNYTAHRLQVGMGNIHIKAILGTCESSKLNVLVMFSVLRRIRQLEKKLMMTDNRLLPVREGLSKLSSSLSSAQEILHKAATTVQETEDKNKANSQKLQRKEVISLMTSFPAQLLTVMCVMSPYTQNVSKYHAAIDGASQKLTEKTERLSLSDRDLVQRADDHAEKLDREANQLEEDLREADANGFVQRAISAANVYNNIIKYINDANITSLTTFNLSQRAEDVRLIAPNFIMYILSFLSVLNSFKSLFKSYYCSHSCPGADRRKRGCHTAPLDGSKEMHNLHLFSDRTPQRLEFTMEVAEGTLNRSSDVLQTIIPISNKVEEWAKHMKNNEYSTTAYNEAVDSAGEAVENLNGLVPELLDKLKVVENKKPVNNVTTNIVRIRELIAQARSVAKKVQVSMKFTGQSSVEVHPHSNLEELKTVTSISLFMRVDPDKDPIEDRFVLYLGDRNGRKDYMGLAIKNDNLVFVYNLGGEDVEIALSSKPVSQWPAVFNFVKIERLGRHGKVFLTIPSQSSTDEQKFIQKGEAPGTDSLFDIDQKDIVFFVGGVPPDVRLPPPLSLAPFVGCIELSSLNNDVISLYNFKETHKIDMLSSPPCPRLAFSQSRIASYLFDGTGYALVNNIERRSKFGVVTRFDIAVRTVANNGVLFLMVNEAKFFLLELKNGFLRLMYDFGFSKGPKLLESHLSKLQINDARYHEVTVIYHQSKKVILLVDKSHVKSMENPRTTLPFSDIYIGGAPSNVLKSRPELSSVVGLKGCVKGFQFQKKDFNLLEEPGTIGISSGCPEESFMSRKAYFDGESYLGSTAKISPFDNFEGGLNFRTLQPSGLLFYHNEGSEEFSISIENGAVVLNTRGTKVKSHKKQYSDGRTHFLVASVNNQKYSLLVDDKDKQEKKRPASATMLSSEASVKTFYFGGTPSSGFKNFTGCISYAYINRQDRDIEAEDFQKYTDKVQASLQDCPIQSPPSAMLLNKIKPLMTHDVNVDKVNGRCTDASMIDDKEANVEPCYLPLSPRATRQAFHYGGISNSRQHYTDISNTFSERSHFSLSLKTHSSFGLIFYVSDDQEDDFMALFLAHGKLVYTFNVANQRVKIRSDKKYNDGAWHNVICIRDGSMGRLIIDGLTVLEDRAHGTNVSWHFISPLYVGGVPPGTAQKNIQRNSAYSFTGCLKNLQLDGQWLSSVSETFGVTPCFQGLSEAGTYFSEEGGYLILDESFDLGLKFELVMEVRPRVASAVLMHVRSDEGYFTIYIHQGAVVARVNDGTNEFFTELSPRLGMCDGTWHRITVIRNANVIQLDVDSEINHVVGPVTLTSTDIRKPVFIGGAPESIPTRKAYVGCMRNLTINNSRASFSKAVLVSGAVSVGSCPAA
uniref:Laminin subunit alpha 4 n=1 Tax=Gouania willdenowi TaxID=441366 RepID=A0A8C5I4S0_GOUWI